MLRHGENISDLIRRQGDIWAQAVMQAGQGIGGAIERIPQEREALAVSKSRREALEEETSARRQGHATAQRRNEILGSGGKRSEILKALENDPDGYKLATEHFTAVDNNWKRLMGEYAAGVRKAGDNPAWAEKQLQLMIEGGINPQTVEPYLQRISTKEGVTSLVDTLLKGSPDEGHQRLATPARKLHNAPPGTSVFDENAPAGSPPVFTAPPKAAEPANVGSFEDYVVRKFGQQPTPEQITQARKEYQQADDRPRVTVNTGSGMSPTMEANVINRLSTQWNKAVAPVVELDRQLKLMDAGLAEARKGNLSQGAQVVLVTFQKILDPPSVVRESEYMRSAAGQALVTRIKGAVERLTKGGAGVPVDELEKFADLARQAALAQASGYSGAVKERIGKTADRFKIPRELVFEDFDFQGAMGGKAPAAASAPAGPKVGDVVRGYRFLGGDPADPKSWKKQ
jgi:hypothetical protein